VLLLLLRRLLLLLLLLMVLMVRLLAATRRRAQDVWRQKLGTGWRRGLGAARHVAGAPTRTQGPHRACWPAAGGNTSPAPAVTSLWQ
jgi:hypothetical protein